MIICENITEINVLVKNLNYRCCSLNNCTVLFSKGLARGAGGIFKVFLGTNLNAMVREVGYKVTDLLLCLSVLPSTNPFNPFDTSSTRNKMILNESRPTEDQISESSEDHQYLFPCFTFLPA